MTVTVSHLRDWVRPERTERRRVPWGIGCTARNLAPEWAEPGDRLVGCSRNGMPVTDWDAQLTDGDHLHFWARPGFIEVAWTAGAIALGNAVLFSIYAYLINKVLLSQPKPVEPGDESSPTYSFSPLQRNARGEGVAVPKIYGRHRFAPVVINEQVRSSIDSNGNPLSEYLALYLVGAGPIHAIGDKTADGGPFTVEAGNALATLEINGQPAANFSGVEAHVRLGNLEQDAIAEFAEPVLQFSVDKTLRDSDALTHVTSPNDLPTFVATAAAVVAGGTGYTNGATVTVVGGSGTAATFLVASSGGVVSALTLVSGGNYSAPPTNPVSFTGGAGSALTANLSWGGNSIAIPGQWSPTIANVTKWDAQEVYVAEDDADEFTAILYFPEGLISYNTSTGAPLSNSVIYQIRYREVDGSGTPFGNYVVLPAEQRTLTRRGALRLEARHKFYLPSAYNAPTTGLQVESRATSTNNPGASVSIDPAKYTPAAPATLHFSVACWVQRRNAQAANTTNRIAEWFDNAGNEGWRINCVSGASPSTTTLLQLIMGTGTSQQTVNLNVGFLSAALFSTDVSLTWHHLVVTYEADFTGASARTRTYVDGVLAATVLSAARIQLDASQPVFLGASQVAAAGYDGRFDEFTIWNKTLTPYEVSLLYNGRAPVGTDTANADVIVGGAFDTNAGSSPNIGSPAFGFAALTTGVGVNWKFGSGTNAGTDPILASGAIVKVPLTPNSPHRGKYQVEIMRLDTEDTTLNATSEVQFEQIQLRTYEDFEYPGMALLAVKIPATDQISGGAPVVTARIDGALVPVWDGVDPVYPNIPLTYSRNPAWITADVLTDEVSGLGSVYRPTDLDVAAFDALADFADARIYDNFGRLTIQTAAYLDSAAEAVTFSGVNLGTTYGDVVRYRTATLPANFPQVSTTASEQYVKPILAGLTPSPPAWLTAQAALTAQEVVFVEFFGTVFYIYTRTTQALAAGQTVYTVSGGQTDDNGLEVHDVRARFDGVFDRQDFPAWDAVVQVLQTARAAPIRIGSRISVFIDDVAQPVALVTMASIVQGSWRQGFMGTGDRPNAESADIFDELLDYQRVPVHDEHPDVNDAGGQSSFRYRRVRLEGITRKGQAKRFLRRDLNTFKLVRRWCEFALGIDGIPLVPGEVVAVSHDVPQYGYSGRIYSDCTNTTVKLDREITIAPATSYQIQVEDVASDTRYTVAVSHAAGTYAAGTALTTAAFPSSFAPSKDDEYAFGEVGLESKLYRVVETTLNPQGFTKRFRCVEYVEAVYSDDFGALSAESPSALPLPTAPTVPAGVENLTVSEVTSRGPDGAVTTAARVEFSHIPETYASVGAVDVYLSAGAADTFAGAEHKARLDARSTVATITHAFERGQRYTLWVVPSTRDGASAYHTFASWVAFTPKGLANVVRPPTNLRGAVSGDHVVYEWDDDGDLDHGAIVEIRRGGWILGQPVVAAAAQARTTSAVPNWAGAPTSELGLTAPDLYARVKLRTGQYSEAVRVAFDPSVVGAEGDALEFSEEDIW